DRVLHRQVAGWIRPSLFRRDDDRARELREQLAALRIGRALLVLDRRPLAMPGHSLPPLPQPGTARARAYPPSAPGGMTPRGCGRRAPTQARPGAPRAPRRPPPSRGRAVRG